MQSYNWYEFYDMVRTAIIEHLDPQDDDIAEPAILVEAVERAGRQLAALRSEYDVRDRLCMEWERQAADYSVRLAGMATENARLGAQNAALRGIAKMMEEARERNLLVTERQTERELKAIAQYDIEPDKTSK